MYISWLRSSKIHSSSNSCVRNRNSDFPWKQRRLPVACLKKRPEWKQKSPTPVTMFITLAKKNTKLQAFWKKKYLTWPPTAPHLWSRCQDGFLLHFSLHLDTERIDSWLQWVSRTAGSGDGISRNCMYCCWSPSLVPLFPCQTTFDKRVKKMDASKSRWHLLSCYGDVLGGMERFGAILDSRDDILESFAIGALDASHVHVWLFDGSLWVGSKSLGFPKSKTNLEMIHFMADVEWTRSNNP